MLFVVVAGLFFVKATNYTPFVPDSQPAPAGSGADQTLLQAFFGFEPTMFGVYGVIAAASVVFFAYIGFDIVATTAEETHNPQRDIPRGILGSLAICTVLYVLVSFVVTGMLAYTDERMNTGGAAGRGVQGQRRGLGVEADLAGCRRRAHHGGAGADARAGRVLFAMSRDGLLPVGLAKVHPRFGTPYRITIITGVARRRAGRSGAARRAGRTWSASARCSRSCWSRPASSSCAARGPTSTARSACRGVPWLPILSIAACVWLMVNLSVETWARFIIWLVIGFVIYFLYGNRHSRLGRGLEQADVGGEPPAVCDVSSWVRDRGLLIANLALFVDLPRRHGPHRSPGLQRRPGRARPSGRRRSAQYLRPATSSRRRSRTGRASSCRWAVRRADGVPVPAGLVGVEAARTSDAPQDEDPRDSRRSPTPRGRCAAAASCSCSTSTRWPLLFFVLFALVVLAARRRRRGRVQRGAGRRTARQPVTTLEYLGTSQFWFESFQNWQSEFLAVAVIVGPRSSCASAARRSRSRSRRPIARPAPEPQPAVSSGVIRRARDGGRAARSSGFRRPGRARPRSCRPNTSDTTLGVHDLGRRALGDDRPSLHRDDVVGVAAGQVEVVHAR